MNKSLLTVIAAVIVTTSLISTTSFAQMTVGVDPNANWAGYMNVFNNDAGSQGSYVFGSAWGVSDLKTTINSGAMTLTLQPNFNTYANALGGSDADRAFWTDSTDGGVTAGPNGNKWMEASTLVEGLAPTLGGGGTLTFSGDVSAFNLASPNYAATAFIKALDPGAGWATVINQTVALTGAGAFTVSVDLSAAQSNWVVQYGFAVNGLNANPANEAALGSVVVQGVPEPSTYALLALGAAGLGAHLLRRRRR